MPATSFYADADAAYDTQKSRQDMEPEVTADDADTPADEDLEQLEITTSETERASASTKTRSTDLVRLYLQEIGRVRLLGRDEEVSEAQKVQRYLKLRILLSEAATQGDELLAHYLRIVEAQERLTSELGHRP
ncbi:MAG: sigma-70 factor domain-containing protein, partial [Rivularia sp. (in: cyanobacteria)]